MKEFQIKEFIQEKLIKAVQLAGLNGEVIVSYSARPEIADFQSNICFSIGKVVNDSPMNVADKILPHLSKLLAPYVVCTAVAPGFINFCVTSVGLSKIADMINSDQHYLCEKIGAGKTVVVDYGGANIAKELHMGHLRAPIIGESIKRIYNFFGYKTVGDAHLGDWGLQMGLVMAIMDDQGDLDYYFGKCDDKPNITLDYLNENYPKASQRSKTDEDFKRKAEKFTLLLQKLEEPYYTIWKDIRAVSIKAIERNYDALNCNFDLWYGESDAEKYIDKTVKTFVGLGLAQESEGALVVEVKKDGEHIPIPKKDPNEKQMYKNPMPPLILKKHNGGDLYATTDIATIMQRVEDNKNLAEIIYVTDKRQSVHFEQVFRASKLAGIAPKNLLLRHIGFGTMNGKDGKPFKTREGTTIKLEDIINLVRQKANEKLEQNGIVGENKLALQIGIGAMKFGDLINDVSRDYVFDIEKFLSFEGKTGPYIQYTAVRIKSILAKADKFDTEFDIQTNEEKQIILSSIKLLESYKQAYSCLSTSYVCSAVYNLASAFSTFYNNTKILSEKDKKKRNNYLSICALVLNKLEQALNLLAINIPEKM